MNARTAFCLIALLLAAPALAQNKSSQNRGMLLMPEFAALKNKASASVNVTLGPEIIAMACRFLGGDDPEEAAAKKLCVSLTGIYVRNYQFKTDYAYPKADIDGVRRQLEAPGWSRMVETHNKEESTDVDVFILMEDGKSRGLAVIASQPREFTIVNIVGNIDLEQLHELKGLGVPDLHIEPDKKPDVEESVPAAKPPATATPAPATKQSTPKN